MIQFLNKMSIDLLQAVYFFTSKLSSLQSTGCTVGENIVATTKIRNNYGVIQSFIFTILRLKAIAKRLPLLLANAFKSVKERQLLLSQ
jgi:hypothetical protein